MVLIGITGRKQVGKDTAAKYLCRRHKFIKYAFAQPLKEACKLLFLLSGDQLHDNILKETLDPRWQMTPRQIMQMIGTDIFRDHVDKEFWTKRFQMWLDSQDHENIVISDVRFQNEVDIIKKNGGYVLEVQRHHGLASSDHHASETQVLQGIDMTLTNDGDVKNLFHQIEESMSKLSRMSSLRT